MLIERHFWDAAEHIKDTQRINQKWRVHTDIVLPLLYLIKLIISEKSMMEASLGWVLANIMVKCKKVDNLIVDNLVKEGKVKFYVCYVDDTLLLVKQWDIDKVLKAFNGFD